MDHTVNVVVTFRSKDATALEINIYENPWMKTHTGFHLNAILFIKASVERYLWQSSHFPKRSEKKNRLYRQYKHN
jgi:hypothetical protein